MADSPDGKPVQAPAHPLVPTAPAAPKAPARRPIPPGATVGIVGGGQLGRMLAMCARRFGYKVAVLTGGPENTPAGVLADVEIAAPFSDAEAIGRFVAAADVITWEFENVDVSLAEVAAAAQVPVRPAGALIAIAQDRQNEKLALENAGLTVAPWRVAESFFELRTAVEELGVPVIAKAARFGYDGKAQARIDHPNQAAGAWSRLGGQRMVVESVVGFSAELSVVVARGLDGATADHGVMHNDHADHILDLTTVPADISEATAAEATAIARSVAEALDLVGVLCVELFATPDGLVVNEIAPRPHNSGHCTIEAAPASQFEQQLRAVCGLPLGDGRCRPAAMAQLLGDLWDRGEPPFAEILDESVSLHLYGKAEARPGRKMGHITALGDSPEQARSRVLDARARISPPAQRQSSLPAPPPVPAEAAL